MINLTLTKRFSEEHRLKGKYQFFCRQQSWRCTMFSRRPNVCEFV